MSHSRKTTDAVQFIDSEVHSHGREIDIKITSWPGNDGKMVYDFVVEEHGEHLMSNLSLDTLEEVLIEIGQGIQGE